MLGEREFQKKINCMFLDQVSFSMKKIRSLGVYNIKLIGFFESFSLNAMRNILNSLTV